MITESNLEEKKVMISLVMSFLMWRVVGKAAMKEIPKRIKTSPLADEFIEDSKNGQKKLFANREAENVSQIEEVGETIRSLFSWIQK